MTGTRTRQSSRTAMSAFFTMPNCGGFPPSGQLECCCCEWFRHRSAGQTLGPPKPHAASRDGLKLTCGVRAQPD